MRVVGRKRVGVGFGEYVWIGKHKNRGGVGFPIKEYLCDIIEVIRDT